MKRRQRRTVHHEVWKLLSGEWCSWTEGAKNTERSARAKAREMGDGFAYVRVTVERPELKPAKESER